MRGWIALAFGGTANPYVDEASVAYAYDERVQNHKRVEVGDVLFVRNRHLLEGVGRITRIDTSTGEKTFFRCPECGSSRIHSRKRTRPRYRCQNGHTFSKSREIRERVKTFKAIYEDDYSPVMVRINAAELRPFQLRNSQQLAIMPVDLDGIFVYLARRDRAVSQVLARWLLTRATSLADDEADEGVDLTPLGFDERAKVRRAIRVRRGQYAFRQSLMTRFGARCIISACTVQGVLEAAHIRPYRGPQDNHPANGLLLRADLHTLFDLNLIAIQPETLRIVIHSDLRGTEYDRFTGQQLLVDEGRRPDLAALKFRWDDYKGTVKLKR